MSKSRVPFLTGYLAVRIRHARLQITVITNKMQHFMAKMLKKNSGRGHSPLPGPLLNGEGTPPPHTPPPSAPYSERLWRSGSPSYYFLIRPLPENDAAQSQHC